VKVPEEQKITPHDQKLRDYYLVVGEPKKVDPPMENPPELVKVSWSSLNWANFTWNMEFVRESSEVLNV
jgi:hypothetical protein